MTGHKEESTSTAWEKERSEQAKANTGKKFEWLGKKYRYDTESSCGNCAFFKKYCPSNYCKIRKGAWVRASTEDNI